MPEKNDEVKFTLKLHPELAAKLNYIAEYYGRTRSAEIIWTLRQHVVEFEKLFGKITEEEYKWILVIFQPQGNNS